MYTLFLDLSTIIFRFSQKFIENAQNTHYYMLVRSKVMENFSDRLSKAMKERRINATQLSEKTGIDN